MFCSQCGEKLKDEAQFCHKCGAGVAGAPANVGKQQEKGDGLRSWLNSFGAFLFIPLFAIVVVLLFWSNKEPEQLGVSNGNAAPSGEASMAAMNNVHKTLERLKSNIEKNPEDLVSIDSLAVMYSIAGSYDKSKDYYEMHMALDPDNKDIKIALALTYNNLSNNDKAVALIKEVLDKEPNYVFALHYMAELQGAMHNHEEAERLSKQIIKDYPGTEFAKLAAERLAAHKD